MNTVNILAEIYGGVLILVGLTIFNKKYMSAFLNDLTQSKGLAWLTGIVTFLVGITIVTLYNVWSSDWRVLVTILGWLTLIKGAAITLWPGSMMSFYKQFKGNSVMIFGALIAVILGVTLLYFGLTG